MLNFKSVLKISSEVRSSLCNYQSIRWRRPRKPFWLGIAKSKMFVIPKPKVPPLEECLEYRRLKALYNTHRKSLLKFITTDDPLIQERIERQAKGSVASDEFDKMINDSLERNELWNAESAKFREERLKEKFEKHVEIAALKLEEKEMKKKKISEVVDHAVKEEIERSKSFITSKNLDEAIDNCLSKLVNYNFAIDNRGNKYYGDEMPETKKPQTSQDL